MTIIDNKPHVEMDAPQGPDVKRSLPLVVFAFVVCIGFGIMLVSIVYAVLNGDLSVEGPLLADMPWGRVSLVDIYLGLLLLSFWVLWREKFSFTGVCWAALIITLGNMVSCLYILKSLQQAQWNMNRFWLGKHYMRNEENV